MMFVAFKKGTVGFPLGREKGGELVWGLEFFIVLKFPIKGSIL
jgi:hypothetical protein